MRNFVIQEGPDGILIGVIVYKGIGPFKSGEFKRVDGNGNVRPESHKDRPNPPFNGLGPYDSVETAIKGVRTLEAMLSRKAEKAKTPVRYINPYNEEIIDPKELLL